MKRIISAALAALTLLSATACGRTVPDTAVTATASAAEQVLVDRFGEIPSNVILGDAAVAAEYGIDMSSFEDEGYIVRTVGDSTLVFGKTDAGLDRAVRYYANYVHGNDTPADVTFGEGARVDRFTIEGHDISEYVITVTEAHPEGSYPASTNFAAEELVTFIKMTTGVVVPIVAEADLAEGQLHFRLTCDGSGSNGEEGFTVTVTPEGNVNILGGLKRGCFYAACDIAEKWLGMRFVNYDYIHIYEAEHISITTADSYSDEPGMIYRYPSSSPLNPGQDSFATDLDTRARNRINGNIYYDKYGYTPKGNGSHGLYKYWPATAAEPNMCMHDEDILTMVIENIDAELWNAKESGALYKGNYYHVNLGLNDTSTYCYCEDCLSLAKETGAQTEAYARFVKEIADTFAEDFPQVQFAILAYNGTEKPSETVLPDNVTVTYCITSPCYCGPMDGSECREDRINDNGLTSAKITEYVLGWKAVTKNLNLWTYYFTYTVNIPKNPLTHLYDDVKYMTQTLGVDGVFMEFEHSTFSYDVPGTWVLTKLMWDPDMSREEYDALVEEIMYLTYGDGYEYLLEYTDIYDSFVLCADSNIWGGAEINYSSIAAQGDYLIYLFDEALRLAETERERRNIDLLSAHVLCNVMTGRYKAKYVNGTAEEKAEYEALAARLKEIFDGSGATYISFMRETKISDIDYTADPYTWLEHR